MVFVMYIYIYIYIFIYNFDLYLFLYSNKLRHSKMRRTASSVHSHLFSKHHKHQLTQTHM